MLAVKRAFGRLPRPLRLAALADEEGMMLGVKAFVRAGLHHGFRGALVAEPEAKVPTGQGGRIWKGGERC
jgi:succinyl-diaminopimelate desuccinylase